MQNSEERVLHAAEGEEGHGSGNADIDADIATDHLILERLVLYLIFAIRNLSGFLRMNGVTCSLSEDHFAFLHAFSSVVKENTSTSSPSG